MVRTYEPLCLAFAGILGACAAPSPPVASPPLTASPRATPAPPAATGPLAIDLATAQRTLGNGLTVIVVPDPRSGIVEMRLYYQVGSRDETTGETGLAHLFEHMMFNGAKRYGPKQFDAVLERAGGYASAFTTTDYTCYFTAVPPASVPTVLELEADRMADLDLNAEMLERERQVVLQERRQVLENSPEASLGSLLMTSLYHAHAYRWPVIGWIADIEAASVASCKRFYARHYAPDNAVLVLAGAIEPDAAFAQAEAAFGKLSPSQRVRAVLSPEPERHFASRVDIEREAGAPVLLVGFVGPRPQDPDHARLDLLAQVLVRGRTARLPQRLIRREQVVSSMRIEHDWTLDGEPLTFELTLPPGQAEAPVLDALFAEFERLAREGVAAPELARARTAAAASLLRGLATASGRAALIGQYEVVAGPHRQLFELPARYEQIDSAQLQDVCRRLLRRERAAVGMLRPRAKEAAK